MLKFRVNTRKIKRWFHSLSLPTQFRSLRDLLPMVPSFKRLASRQGWSAETRKIVQNLAIPGLILAITLLTYLAMIIISHLPPRAPRLRPGRGDVLYNASNKNFSTSIGTKDGSSNIGFSVGNGHAQFILAGSSKVTPKKESNTAILFPEVQPGVDLRYTTTPNGVKEELNIKQYDKNRSNVYLFDLQLTGVIPKNTTTEFIDPTFKDKDGKYLFHFEKPFAVDANGSRTNDILLQIAQDKQLPGKYFMKLIVDPTWLADPARAYPITIDPTIIHDSTAEFVAGTFNRLKDTGSGTSPTLESYYGELPADQYTVGLWHMNETTDNTCTGGTNDICDKSVNARDGAATGTTINTTTQKLGTSARTFNGTSDFVSAGTNPITGSAPFTLEAWMNPSNHADYGLGINIGNAAANSAAYIGYVTTASTGTSNSIGGGFYGTNYGSGVAQGTGWHHVAMTFSGGTSGTVKLYVDGRETLSTTATPTLASTAITFGKANTGTAYYFNGGIDEVRISNIARTPEQIKSSASRSPYSVYTSPVIDFGSSITSWNPLSWTELGVNTGDGETLKSSSGLIAQWNFNETSGTTADNAEGTSALDGTLTSFASTGSQDAAASTGWTSANKRWGAGALMFDGTDDYVNAGSNAALQTTGDFSVESWFKTSDSAGTLPFVSYGTTSDWLYFFGTNLGNVYCKLYQANSGSAYLVATSSISVSDGAWHHAVCTISGTTISVYVDGKLSTTNSTTAGSRDVSSAGTLTIGKFTNSSNLFYKGPLDSTRIYSRVLDSNEIMANYQAGNIELQTRVGSDTSPDDGSWSAWGPTTGETQINSYDSLTSDSLVSYYHLDEATGDRYDSAGTNNLTQTNTPTHVDGKINKAASFVSASSQYLACTDANCGGNTSDKLDMTASQSFTFGAWVKTTATGVNRPVIVKKSNLTDTTKGYSLYVNTLENALCRIADDTTTVGIGTTANVSDGNWHHVLCVVDRTAQTMTRYVDNVASASVDITTVSGTLSNIQDFLIARSNANYFEGQIDEAAVWKKALTAAEVSTLYSSSNPKTHIDGTDLAVSTSSGLQLSSDPLTFVEGTASQKIESGKPRVDGYTVGLWHLDETGGSGAYIKDSTANANNGTPTGTTVVNGVSGKGRNFNGSSDYIDAGDSSVFDFGSGNFTLEAWVKRSTTGTNDQIIAKHNSTAGTAQFHLFITSSNTVRTSYFTSGDAQVYLDTTATITDLGWHHIVGQRSGNSFNIYIDGTLSASGTTGGTHGSMQATSTNLLIGRRHYSGLEDYFAGSIDEVKIDNVARSAEEIAESYRSGRDHYINKTISATDLSAKTSLPFYVAADRPGSYLSATVGESAYANYQPDSNTAGLWHLDENSGTGPYLKDSSGSNNHGSTNPPTYGTGADGDCSIPSGTVDINTASCTGKATADAINFSVTANTTAGQSNVTVSTTPTGLAVNDEVLIINLQGVSGNSSNVGLYETGYITNISTNTLTLNKNLVNTYDGTTQKIMVQRVPNYRNVSVSGGATMVGTNWGGTKNGLLFFRSSGITTVAGSINMDSRGYLRGASRPSGDVIGRQGDSLIPDSVSGSANLTGGGGGLAHNNGVCNPSAGGGGGYGSAGTTSTNKTNSCAGGGIGGATTGSTAITSLFMGGGGGSGGNKINGGGTSGAGGDGGGIIGIFANTLTVTGSITSNGETGSAPSCTSDACGDGGGGGAGGSVLIYAATPTLGSSLVTATGGTGNNSGSHSTGGNGGNGRIAIYYANTPSGTTSPAATTFANGITTGPTATTGKIGLGRSFNGTTEHINAGNNASLQITGQLTVEAWVKTSASITYRGIVGKMGNAGGQYGYLLRMANSTLPGAAEFGISSNGTTYQNVVGTTLINDDKWHHIVGVYTPSTSLKIYVDGQLQATNTTSIYSSIFNTSASVSIGSSYSIPGAAEFFSGQIDEARISNTARTATEIRQAFEIGSRTHQVTIDFGAKLDSGNLITGSGDLGFTVDATYYGLNQKGDALYPGDKIIVKENYDGTEYVGQGTVTSVTASTGAVTISAWDSGSTFPSGGYTANASVFKWQREYWNIDGEVQDSSLDAITNLTLRLTDGSEGRTIYLDDMKSNGGNLTTPTGSTITSSIGSRYFQYRAVLSSFDEAVTSTLSGVTLNYITNIAPNTATLDLPTNSTTNQLLSPVLYTTATDTDSDYLRYKIVLCTNIAMTTGCQTFDQTSSQTGWSGQNAQTSSAYTSGTQATYTIQTQLSAGTAYYWQSYAIDPGGSNEWSQVQEAHGFTTSTAPTAPTVPYAEGTSNPIGVTDITPEFSAIHNDSDNDSVNKYQIQVNTNSSFTGTTMWDSGSTSMSALASGARSSDYSYAGTTLALDGTTYYWRIRFTDVNGAVGAWSATQNFIMNTPANAPSLDYPLDAATEIIPLTPLKTTGTDTNSDYLRYKIQLCTNLAMSIGCQTFDQTSSQTGWSGQNAQTSTAYTSGTQATYTIQSALYVNTIYYWRSYAIDPAGSNTWSATQSTPFSFTTTSTPFAASSCRLRENNTDTGITIVWTDNDLYEAGYQLQRSTDGGAYSTIAGFLSPDTTSYSDTAISSGHTYSYRVAPYFTGPILGAYCTTAPSGGLNLGIGTFKIN